MHHEVDDPGRWGSNVSDGARDGQTPTLPEADVEDLRAAVNEAAKHVTTRFTTFLFVTAYLAVTVGATTDEDLLRESPLILPLLGVGLPLVPFFLVMPWFYLIMHAYLLLQLVLLAEKVLPLVRGLRDRPEELAAQREKLFPFPLVHLLAGGEADGRIKSLLLHATGFSTTAVVPLLVLLGMLWRFLPYHSVRVSTSQQVAVLVDLALIWLIWPIVLRPRRLSRRSRKTELPGPPATPRTARGVRSRIGNALRSAVRFVVRLPIILARFGARPLTVNVTGSLIVVFLAFSVLVIPGTPLDWLLPRPDKSEASDVDHVPSGEGWQANFIRLLHRNLVVRGKTLVAASPAPEVLAAYAAYAEPDELAARLEEGNARFSEGLDLRGRDLRGADLSDSRLYNANLNPRGWTKNADVEQLIEWDDQTGESRRGEELERICAKLQGARLKGTALLGAGMFAADLSQAELSLAVLDKARLIFARLHGADLSFSELHGADLRWAKLHGADLTGAKLHGADLSKAKLSGAILEGAELHGADLRWAKLHGSDLTGAKLHGADLDGAELHGALLSMANLTESFGDCSVAGCDARALVSSLPLSEEAWNGIAQHMLASVRDAHHKLHVEEHLEQVRKPGMAGIEFEIGPDPPASWDTPAMEAETGWARADYLIGLACGDKWIAAALQRRVLKYHPYMTDFDPFSSSEDPQTDVALAIEILHRRESGDCEGINALSDEQAKQLEDFVSEHAEIAAELREWRDAQGADKP